MNLQILSNINMDSLKYYFKNINIDYYCSYGSYLLDLTDEHSPLYTQKTKFVFIFIDADEFQEDIDDFIKIVESFIKKTNKIVILNTISFSPLAYIDTFLHNTLEKELNINKKLFNLYKKNQNILLFDFTKIVKENTVFDERFWYLARIKFNKIGFEKIASEIETLLYTYKYGSKKVLILDMDNTLWGGIIGEEEIELSNDGIGKIYKDFQYKIKKLKDLGILLAICSKNNYKDGIKGLKHPNSVLKENDFIIKKINWQDKATNIQEISKELNLGLDSFVFIDDNPVEREYIKTTLPSVEVPDFPKDIYNLNSWFLQVIKINFSKLSLTAEDLKKQEQYSAKIKRDSLSKKIGYDEFLKNLNIKLKFYIDDKRFIQRYAQMTQKTNQFNLTTKRYTIQDIQSFIENPKYKVIAIEYQDKFANEGIIGLVIAIEEKDEVKIDTFLLSCRVLKRKVEDAIFEKLDKMFPKKNIIGIFYPTPKNMQVKDLYEKFGFEKIDENNFIKRIKK